MLSDSILSSISIAPHLGIIDGSSEGLTFGHCNWSLERLALALWRFLDSDATRRTLKFNHNPFIEKHTRDVSRCSSPGIEDLFLVVTLCDRIHNTWLPGTSEYYYGATVWQYARVA